MKPSRMGFKREADGVWVNPAGNVRMFSATPTHHPRRQQGNCGVLRLLLVALLLVALSKLWRHFLRKE